MTRQNIAIGATGNDGTGDTLRVAGGKINDNFSEIYIALGGDSSTLSTGITLTNSGIVFEGSIVDAYETTLVGGNPTAADLSLSLPIEGSVIVADTATQTLTNKTLTAPVLTSPQINDTTADHQYVFAVSELTADRTITLPLLTGNDEITFNDHTQTIQNKTLISPVLNTPKIGASLDDSSGAMLIGVASVASAVNNIKVSNSATGNSPLIEAEGTDTNVNLNVAGKGTGAVGIQTAIQYNPETITADGAMGLTVPLTVFNSASPLAITLANGTQIGETKYFLNKGSATATITPTNLAGGSTVAVATNEAGFIMWSGSNWHLASKTTA